MGRSADMAFGSKERIFSAYSDGLAQGAKSSEYALTEFHSAEGQNNRRVRASQSANDHPNLVWVGPPTADCMLVGHGIAVKHATIVVGSMA